MLVIIIATVVVVIAVIYYSVSQAGKKIHRQVKQSGTRIAAAQSAIPKRGEIFSGGKTPLP